MLYIYNEAREEPVFKPTKEVLRTGIVLNPACGVVLGYGFGYNSPDIQQRLEFTQIAFWWDLENKTFEVFTNNGGRNLVQSAIPDDILKVVNLCQIDPRIYTPELPKRNEYGNQGLRLPLDSRSFFEFLKTTQSRTSLENEDSPSNIFKLGNIFGYTCGTRTVLSASFTVFGWHPLILDTRLPTESLASEVGNIQKAVPGIGFEIKGIPLQDKQMILNLFT
jgi:hypothetical protein